MKSRLYRAFILIAMMFGHNYVLNQAQSMQSTIQQLHELKVTEFNFLYSIPSAVSIFIILPLGILYDRHAQKILLFGAFSLLIGQFLVTIFGPNFFAHSFLGLIIGRVLQGNGAQVLYMIQGNLASTWMSNTAGMIFILPEIGQIFNVLVTPVVDSNYGILAALLIGLITCIISFIACIMLYRYLSKVDGNIQLLNSSPNEMTNESQAKPVQIQTYASNQLLSMVSQKKTEKEQEYADKTKQQEHEDQQEKIQKFPKSILEAGKVFWLILVVCSINQCLYFPFLDNANVLIQTRFCVPTQKTGMYLCLPFLSAMATTFLLGKYILGKHERKILIFIASLIPFIGHLLIYINRNCQNTITLYEQVFLVSGLVLFGAGLGSYYSISFPAVGLAVPESIRGTAYACLCLCQTISMTVVPEISALIIQDDQINNDNYMGGYRNSSFFFVCLCSLAVIFSFLVYTHASVTSFSYDDYQNEKKSQNAKTPLKVTMQQQVQEQSTNY